MTIQAHINALERRHEALDKELIEVAAHTSTDDLKSADLKREIALKGQDRTPAERRCRRQQGVRLLEIAAAQKMRLMSPRRFS